ncbi:GuaB3 family IMP dehydrogenase-related protein [Actinomyces naeslundii]|uniref:Guanosine monophosphate reductase n=4 Tax=Actinomyces naeslundii TaxID=1655 RepID=A0A1Q8XNU5_ACTNA|nr:GuaB3 family IMP dehydrogenase-related protein [Actinomyces naeslundii]EJN85436.1 IMP dehydrogenase family protein [Actinomyces naeslundii str. Howell 279]OLO80503.1 inosine 5-monophosphate dehydrogenase [Actinomyces naeslundii]OLO84823.1 inosine 5-monophosphate dehydrogenase [Actinomyces naeslundii]OLO89550.1 inosine 5-monophosphate dehydrogenase [Actinomyces naeslundii]OLO90278.1 inosine 5-monophosphate dehydrogenase [Actinomyces naeslundii]
MSTEVEIGRSKRALRAYSFDDIALVPARRTRDTSEVRVGWQIDAYHVDLPVMASPMDSVMSPETAIMVGRLGGIGVLDLEGLWTRYEDPTDALERIRRASPSQATSVLQEVYRAPVRPELITERLTQIRASGVVVAGRLSPAQTQRHWRTVLEAGVDLMVIRGSFVSAEHVSGAVEPLNLKRFIYELDVPVVVGGVTTYTAALHLMRTGAAGVLVGQGGGASSSVRQVLGLHMPMATAVADVAGARRDYLDESGGRYVHVIADGSVGNSGDVVKAIACGADAVMLGAALARAEEAPGGGYHWGAEARHERLPRGFRSYVGTVGTMAEILNGPSDRADGTLNIMGALRRTLATTGYADVKELQRVEVVLSPYAGSAGS